MISDFWHIISCGPLDHTNRACLDCKSPTLFLGSTDSLDILLLVRLPVCRAARALHCTGDMNTHSPLSVIIFFTPTLFLNIPCPEPPRALPPVGRPPYSILEDCPLYSRKLFCFSIFFVICDGGASHPLPQHHPSASPHTSRHFAVRSRAAPTPIHQRQHLRTSGYHTRFHHTRLGIRKRQLCLSSRFGSM